MRAFLCGMNTLESDIIHRFGNVCKTYVLHIFIDNDLLSCPYERRSQTFDCAGPFSAENDGRTGLFCVSHKLWGQLPAMQFTSQRKYSSTQMNAPNYCNHALNVLCIIDNEELYAALSLYELAVNQIE